MSQALQNAPFEELVTLSFSIDEATLYPARCSASTGYYDILQLVLLQKQKRPIFTSIRTMGMQEVFLCE